MISEEKIAEIRERTDVVALVGEYVALKRVGASFRGLCPFHSEKSPSFYVHPARQFFHCFGCQASGDVIKFIQQIEGRSFPEALRLLAERAGVEIPAEDAREDAAVRQARARTERLVAITDAAAGFFLRMLVEHPLGGMAREEITRRGVTEDTARTYRLGYAPHGWDHLARFLAQRGFSPEDCIDTGLVAPRRSGDGHYDRFRHRLMFPIADVHGRIVAFSGRILDPPPGEAPPTGDPPAKYVNSPEGPLYHKGELLFGLHEARVDLRRESEALMCEGNFDVLALHQAGCRNVVAPLGTAFTAQQAKLLKRYVARVILIFDGDKAGQKATRGAYPLLMEAGLSARVAALPRGEDPDSFLRKRGPEALRALVANAPPIVEHLIESSAGEAGVDPASRAQAIAALGPILAQVGNPVETRLYIERIAQVFDVRDIDAVRRQLRQGLRQAGPPPKRRTSPGDVPSPEPAKRVPPPEYPALEKDVVGAILDWPELASSSDAEKLPDLLTSADLRGILRHTTRMVASGGVIHASELLAAIGESPARPWLEERFARQELDDLGTATLRLRDAIGILTRQWVEREQIQLMREIKQARLAGDEARALELERRRIELFRTMARPALPS